MVPGAASFCRILENNGFFLLCYARNSEQEKRIAEKKNKEQGGPRQKQGWSSGPFRPLSCGVDGLFAERWSRTAELRQ